MSKSKIVLGGEWVKVSPLLNKRFVPDDPRCEACFSLSCAPGWMSIKTKKFRCKKCYDPLDGLTERGKECWTEMADWRDE